ncbi:hypothetical protein E2P81_ATG11639 [Venturia nashicola]|uniref:Mid2 domain-containing protein n=1 Tax=Venturia nashicola TaxID=86259 RepID=A0A4Z1NDH2_9PEZI|nr:hypothetical protein E6O75_ATG11332 [Venturia nashicola]TLD18729.1 hypothetical protein E2P81_ATG11639 [Venturia nashicola]
MARVVFMLILLTIVSAQQCYYPNGRSAEGGSKDIPCGGTTNKGCCPQGWACSSNGLCYNSAEDWWGRYTCTDKSWGSSCLDACTTGPGNGGNEAVLWCPNAGKYCCDGNRSTDCCQNESNDSGWLSDINYVSMGTRSSNAQTQSATRTTSSGTSSTTEPTSSETTSATSQLSSAASHSSYSSVTVVLTRTASGSTMTMTTTSRQISSSTNTVHTDDPAASKKSSGSLGMIIGLAVGVPLVLLALGLLGFACWRRRRNNKRDSDVSSIHPFYSGQPPAEKVLEIPDRGPLPSSEAQGPVEMQGSHSYTQRYPVEPNPFQNRPDLMQPPEHNEAWSRETTMMTLPGAVNSGGHENVSPDTASFSPPYSPVSSQSAGHRPYSYSEFSPNIPQGAWGQGQAQELGGGVRPAEMEGSRISTIAELPA